MAWFRNKKGKGEALEEVNLSASAQKIANWVLAVQARWAAKLNTQAQKFGRKKTNVLLAALGIGFGIYCLWLVRSAFME